MNPHAQKVHTDTHTDDDEARQAQNSELRRSHRPHRRPLERTRRWEPLRENTVNHTIRNIVTQDRDAIYDSEYRHQIEKGAGWAWADARACKAVGRAEKAAQAPDESRLKGHLKLETKADRQTRGGGYADLDALLRAADTIKACLDATSSPTQRARAQLALDGLANKGKPNRTRRQNRTMWLRMWRKSLRTLIGAINPDKYAFAARVYADVLLKIEAEIAFLNETENGTMHVDTVVSMLPLHAERVGRDALVDRFKQLLQQYGEAYTEAMIAAVDTSTEIRLPSLISAHDLGVRFQLTTARLKHHFPKGGHGITPCDRDQINAERKAKGLKIRTKPKPKTRKQIAEAAAEQRDIEELMEHFGYTRETVMKWRSSKPKPGSDLWGEKFWDMYDLMQDQKAAGIDPKGAKDDLPPELQAALMKHYNVTDAAIRQWRKRKQLDAKIAEYRRATALTVVD